MMDISRSNIRSIRFAAENALSANNHIEYFDFINEAQRLEDVREDRLMRLTNAVDTLLPTDIGREIRNRYNYQIGSRRIIQILMNLNYIEYLGFRWERNYVMTEVSRDQLLGTTERVGPNSYRVRWNREIVEIVWEYIELQLVAEFMQNANNLVNHGVSPDVLLEGLVNTISLDEPVEESQDELVVLENELNESMIELRQVLDNLEFHGSLDGISTETQELADWLDANLDND